MQARTSSSASIHEGGELWQALAFIWLTTSRHWILAAVFILLCENGADERGGRAGGRCARHEQAGCA